MTVRMKCVAAILLATFVGASGFILGAQEAQPVGTWAAAGVLAGVRPGGAAVPLEDGRTLIVGGVNADGTPGDRVVIVDPATNTSTTAGHLLAARQGHSATLVGNARVLVAGGTIDGSPVADVELFDLETGASTPAGTLTQARTGHAAARLPNGAVLIVGGSNADDAVMDGAETVNPDTGTATALASHLNTPRAGASATALIDGRVLIAGGHDGTGDLGSAELYEPVSKTFALLDTSLSVARSGHTALLLPHNNSVLLAGGRSNGSPQTAADLFLPAEFPDPFSYGVGTFAAASAMATARAGAASGPGHAEGFAIVAGGGSSDVERYRFATIKTDKDDYAPGQQAVITGSGWQPGRQVTLLFQEDPAVHDDYVLTVTANAEGNIYWDQWAPELHDLGVRFYLTASDGVSKAQTTFTDALNTATTIASSLNPSLVGQSVTFTATVKLAPPSGTSPVTVGTVTFRRDGQNCNNSTALSAPLSLNASGQATFTTSFGAPGTFIIRACYAGTAGSDGTQNSDALLSQVVNAASANRPPTVTLAGDASADEGAEKTYTFTVSDPDSGETFSLVNATCGANGQKQSETINATTGAGNVVCKFPDGPANSTVSVEVSDGDASGTDTRTVAIANVAPTVTLNGPSTADEGQTKSYTYTVTDPGDDPNPTIVEACGPKGQLIDTATANHFDCKFLDGPESSEVTVTADDRDTSNNLGTASINVAIANVAPTVTLTGDNSANEGQTKSYAYTVSDPGDDPNPTIVEACGPKGLRIDTATANHFECTFPDGPESSEVKVTADDRDLSNNLGSASINVTIANVAPTVTLTGDDTANEGQTKLYTYTVTDPGDDPNPTIVESCGPKGQRIDTATANHFECTFPDGPAASEVKVTADDHDTTNNIGCDTISVAIANVLPSVDAGAALAVAEGTAFVQGGSFVDPGADTWTATVNYGDGSATQALPLNADKTFSLGHAYGDNGPFTITVQVTDKDGGVGTATVAVTVSNVAPEATGTLTVNPYTGQGSATVNFSDKGWRDVVSSTFNWANLGPGTTTPASIGPGSAPSLTGTFTSTFKFDPGCITNEIGAVVTDDDGGQAPVTLAAASTLQVYTVAFLAPIKDGVRNVVKLGNVIPVKLAILDCHGNPITNKTLTIKVIAGIVDLNDIEDGAELIPTSVSAADTTGFMRLADSHYMYNMATKGLGPGLPYTIVIRDGAVVVATAVVEMKK